MSFTFDARFEKWLMMITTKINLVKSLSYYIPMVNQITARKSHFVSSKIIIWTML